MSPQDNTPRSPVGRNDPTAKMLRRCRYCGADIPAASSFCSKCGGTASAPVGPADPLRDRLQALFGTELEIERELGRGGMAVVYAAFDPALQRRVAIKTLLPEIADDEAMAERFLREARTVAALQHPHVVTVYGVRGGGGDGVSAIVMQFVEGRSLDVILLERGQLPMHIAGLLLAQAAEGLQHAHDRGVVHRDVKPANVLIDRDGHAVVSDFGIARRDNAPRTTDTGLVVGTWAYMSPEQRSAQSITPATDQYAFGVMAFEVLTGQLPFRGTAGEMMRAHMVDPVPSLRALRADVPENVEAVVQRMMAKDPAARWPSLKEAERTFRKLVPDEGKTTLQMAAFSHLVPGRGSSVTVAARPGSPASATVGTAEAQSPAAKADVGARGAPMPTRASRWPWAIAAVVGLAALGVWAATRRPSMPTAPAGVGAPAPTNAASSSAAPAIESRVTRALAGGAAAAPSTSVPTAPSGQSVVPGTVPQGAIRPVPLASANATQPSARVETKAEEPSPPRREPEAAAPRTLPAYALTDARRLGREFVTLLNQRRTRDVAQFAAMGGDAAARAELLKLTESAAEFAAGFDRVPAAPEEWTNGFQTEFYVDLEWRGGQKVMRIRLFASPSDAGWRAVGFAADVP